MNIPSQQINSKLQIEIGIDQPLAPAKVADYIINLLGTKNCFYMTVFGKRVLVYKAENGINNILLLANVTYLGGSGVHPSYKKRIQLKQYFKDIALNFSNASDYFVRFMGLYHYNDTFVIVDFEKDSFLIKKMHNSAAHVYINDLYQGLTRGVFKKRDHNGNTLFTINPSSLSDYLNNLVKPASSLDKLTKIFSEFNDSFPFGKWLSAESCVKIMQESQWHNWAQSEWAGHFLEFNFSNFLNNHHYSSVCEYTVNKVKGLLDFDLHFVEDDFYGDLKSESTLSGAILGNDKRNVLLAIEKHGRLWYVVYEHDTIKDSNKQYAASQYINKLKLSSGKWPKNKPYDPFSYGNKMKNSVRYVRMYIIEVNPINSNILLKDFKQGKQPSGKSREVKVSIPKKAIDNFVIFRYNC